MESNIQMEIRYLKFYNAIVIVTKVATCSLLHVGWNVQKGDWSFGFFEEIGRDMCVCLKG